jgi:recombination protein RecA
MARRTRQNKAVEAVAERFSAFRPAREVLRVVRAVPTRFPQIDHALRVGGWPIERFTLVHGPSGDGKTEFSIGLEDSFLALDHFVFHVDAERTSPITWIEQLMGPRAYHPRFFASRPDTYEGTIADVRNFLNLLVAAKEEGEVANDTSALVVVDSLRKLVPAGMMKEILEAEAEAKDVKGGRDRSAQLQAKMNAAWMDELVPLLERAGAGFVAIAREMQDPDADMWSKKIGTDYKIGGGGAIYYDASVVARVERAAWVGEGEGKDRKTYGERRRVTIRKTKVAGKDDRASVAYFHSSNGVLVPAGFDLPRDVLELGTTFLIVEQKGSWLTFEGEKIGNGEHNAVRRLHQDGPLMERLLAAVRGAFEKHEPVAHDEDGVVG